jgi:tetratricopeptide (TPR) repeat protein
MRPILLALTLFTFALPALHAQNAPATPPPAGYVEAIREALRSFIQRDFQATIAALDKADAIQPPTALSLNTRGAVAIEQKRFDEGAKLCREALKLDPKFFPAEFNLAEIPFVQKNYAAAREEFTKLKERYPKEDLLSFRIFLTHILEKNFDVAKEQLDQIPFLSDSPIYYYSHAAWEFAHGNEAEAQKWLTSSSSVFGPEKTLNFAEVFYDIGWLKRSAPAAAQAPAAQ